MSIFGNAKKVGLRKEALDTKKWISDEELSSIFLVDPSEEIASEINALINSSYYGKDEISVDTNIKFNEAKANVRVA